MKKILMNVLLVALIMISTACQYSSNNLQSETQETDEIETQEPDEIETQEPLETLYEPYLAITSEEWKLLNRIDQDHDDITLAGKTVEKICAFAGVFEEDFAEVLTGNIQAGLRYIILGDLEEEAIQVLVDEDGVANIRHYNYAVGDSFFADFKLINSSLEMFGKQCFLYEIVCFDGQVAHMATVNYLVTDQGVFVKYYSSPTTEPLVFTEDDYQFLAAAYEKFIDDPTMNSEPGNVFQASMKFHDFIKDNALVEKYSQETTTE
ncbi:MAG: hypothetical protein J6D87_06290 [Clostridia bacterium]|nr:hypothetical protein [Clostridia bacterium]